MLDAATDGCLAGQFTAMVTGPVQKSVINDAGIAFTGHTEYLAAQMRRPHAGDAAGRRQASRRARDHAPAARRSAAPHHGASLLDATLDVLDDGLRDVTSRSPAPRILVCGLNPHAGEGGHLGREEIDIIAPAVEAARATRHRRCAARCPRTPRSRAAMLAEADAVLAMYHDQGLPVLKHAGFGNAVNVTLGLPFLRTSVDHGTALDLAGTGRADPGSLFAAIRRSRRKLRMIRARKRFGQHFLHDPGVIARIVAAIDPQPGERVVEIGPGAAR